MSSYRNRIILTITAFITLLSTASCSFTPVYGKRTNVNSYITSIKVSAVVPPDIASGEDLARQFKYILIDALNPLGVEQEKKYALELTLSSSVTGSAIQQDNEITRFNLIISANYRLSDIKNNKQIISGKLEREGGYDAVTSDFATYVSRKDTESRILNELAEDFKLHLTSIMLRLNSKKLTNI